MTELMSIKQVGHPPPFERPNLFAGEVMIGKDILNHGSFTVVASSSALYQPSSPSLNHRLI